MAARELDAGGPENLQGNMNPQPTPEPAHGEMPTHSPTPWHILNDRFGHPFLMDADGELALKRRLSDYQLVITAVNSHASLMLERDRLKLEVDDAIKAHGFVWNAVRTAAQYFRWMDLSDPIAVESASKCYEAEKLTPRWSTDWVILTPLELSQLRAERDRLRTALVEAKRDTIRLDLLEALIRHCPHAEFYFSDDEANEKPMGFSIEVDGCEPTSHAAATFREVIDSALAVPAANEGRRE